jgi:polyhydroxyalkanoate synthesis regulator phasin
MKNTIKTLCLVLIPTLAIAFAGCSKKEPKEPQDIESIRTNLREQVASGELTKEEAIVKLAEAIARLSSDAKDKADFDPELEALSKELKEKVASGELTDEEAKNLWIEAAEEIKAKSSAK